MLPNLPDLFRHYSSTDRPAAFATWAEALPRSRVACAAFWATAAREWSGFDAIDHHRFSQLFRRFRTSRPAAFIEHLPERIQIYRGQDAGAAFGLAWTTDRAVAAGFARGHRGIVHDDPYVYEITVTRAEVAFSCDDRSEAEIVLLGITPEMVRQAIENAAENPGF